VKKTIALLMLIALFAAGCSGKAPTKGPENNQPSNQNTGVLINPSEQNTPSSPSPSGENAGKTGVNKVKVFLIAIDDNGKSGKKLGTGDSVVPIEVTVEPTNAPLKAALNKLLSIKDRIYGQSGLYNPLYQSNLILERVTIENGEAKIYLTGNLMLGGVLDNPRVKAQLEEIAFQFTSVQKVSVYINNKELNEVLSLK
jgi:hypothetical protein